MTKCLRELSPQEDLEKETLFCIMSKTLSVLCGLVFLFLFSVIMYLTVTDTMGQSSSSPLDLSDSLKGHGHLCHNKSVDIETKRNLSKFAALKSQPSM